MLLVFGGRIFKIIELSSLRINNILSQRSPNNTKSSEINFCLYLLFLINVEDKKFWLLATGKQLRFFQSPFSSRFTFYLLVIYCSVSIFPCLGKAYTGWPKIRKFLMENTHILLQKNSPYLNARLSKAYFLVRKCKYFP